MRCFKGHKKRAKKGTKELVHIFQMNVTNKLRNNDDLFCLSSDLFEIWNEFSIFFSWIHQLLLGSKQWTELSWNKITVFKMGFKKELDITTRGLLKYTYIHTLIFFVTSISLRRNLLPWLSIFFVVVHLVLSHGLFVEPGESQWCRKKWPEISKRPVFRKRANSRSSKMPCTCWKQCYIFSNYTP